MEALIDRLNSFGGVFVDFAGGMLVQSCLLIAVLLVANFLLKNKVRAVVRYFIWMLVLVKLLLPTGLSSPIGVGNVIGDKLTNAEAITGQYGLKYSPSIDEEFSPPPRAEFPAITDNDTHLPPIHPSELDSRTALPVTWQAAVFLAWAAAVSALILLLLQRAVFVNGLVRQGKEANSALNDALDWCREQLGMRKNVGIKLSANATSPAVCGLFRPVILLPENLASKLGANELRAVLFHELVHIKRGDLWINLVQTLLQIFYFYNRLIL